MKFRKIGAEFIGNLRSNNFLPAFLTPLLVGGGLQLGKWGLGKLFGGGKGSRAPDIGAPQYDFTKDFDTEGLYNQGASAIKGDIMSMLKQQMTGIRKGASQRGLTTSSVATEQGDVAAGQAASKMATGLAGLKTGLAGMKLKALMQGRSQYGQDYNAWLRSQGQAKSNWAGGLLGLIGQMYGSGKFGMGGGKSPYDSTLG